LAIAGVGRFGVDFFFVLSGFVLTWSYRPGRSRGRFYWLRFARVWPLHLVTFLLAIALIGGGPWFSALLNVLLLQSWAPFSEVYGAFNTPSWTLSVEAFFYLLFPFMIRPLARASSRVLVAVCGVAWLVQAS
jgi:peptidoglycan/LPS O-acetylase OafA/YrhL